MNDERIGMPKEMISLVTEIVKDYPDLSMRYLFTIYLEVTADYKAREGENKPIDVDILVQEAKKRITIDLQNKLEGGDLCLN